MTPQQLQSLLDAIILLIVAVSGAITAYTHWKVQQLPTRDDQKQIADKLLQNGHQLEDHLATMHPEHRDRLH